MKLAQLRYPEVAEVLKAGAIALFPTGSTEAHGPHLPLNTDVIIAETSCERAVPLLKEKLSLQGVILPPLAFTVTDCAGPFSGTLSISAETTSNYVKEIIVSAANQGFKAVCLVNAHLEPAHRFALRDAVKAAKEIVSCPVIIADPCDRRWVPTLTAEFQSGKCHAGQYETSLVMAANQQALLEDQRQQLPLVDVDLVAGMKAGHKDFKAMGADQCYFGTPAQATIEEGEQSYAQLAQIVLTMCQEGLNEDEA